MLANQPFLAKKRFSQNFLTDPLLAENICQLIGAEAGDHYFEIGPGQGFLTGPLLKRGPVTAVEIDRDLSAYLRIEYADQALTLFEQDVLGFDFARFFANPKSTERWKLVANLPYHISSPFLFKLYPHRELFKQIFLLLQKELALRFSAKIGQARPKNLGVLGLLGELGFQFTGEIFVPRQAFIPKPAVDSLGLVFEPKPCPVPFQFFNFAKNLYQYRRKTLRNNLHLVGMAPGPWSEKFWNQRPEELDLAAWLELFHYYTKLKP